MKLRNTLTSWGLISVSLHWVSAISVVGLFALGWWMVELNYYSAWYNRAPDIHRSVGILLLLAVTLRLVWRWFNPTPKTLPSISKTEAAMAHAAHVMLYVLLFTVSLSGYAISTADGDTFAVFNWFNVPVIGPFIDRQESLAGLIHEWSAYLLIALAAVHALAALKHHFFDRDRTLKRMLGR